MLFDSLRFCYTFSFLDSLDSSTVRTFMCVTGCCIYMGFTYYFKPIKNLIIVTALAMKSG